MIQFFKNYFWHLPNGILASVWYGFPARKLIMIGVTGTKGKTTTVHLIEHILRKQGLGVARISTIGARIGDQEIDTGFHVTSPDPWELQRLLRLAVDRGVDDVVLEVTSSGLDQFRVWGIPFALGVITNIAPDHLDYHGTFDRYLESKIRLAKQSRVVVLHRQSPGFSALRERVEKMARAKLFIADTSTILPFEMNRELAVKATSLLSIPEEAAAAALASFPGIPGRFELAYDKEFQVVIDFAHTPESLRAALQELRSRVKSNGRLIAVFGSAGQRDPGRRRMGEIAAKYADFFIITAEDPRTERVEDISVDIAAWALKGGSKEGMDFIRIPDRQEAIAYAIEMAKNGDVIGLFGKGHEQSMCFGTTETPWSERSAVVTALSAKAEARRTKKK